MSFSESASQRNARLFGTEQPVCLITGSVAARVGRCIAESLRVEGFEIVWHAHRPKPDAPPTDSGLVLYGPVEQEANVQAWLSQVLERHGRIDVLVNSAAVWGYKPLEETTAEDFCRQFEVNVLGSALMCKHFGLQMVQQPQGGCIINIGDWAIARPYADFASYFPSKGAVETLTRSMAVELAIRNPRIRVSAVLPGPVLISPELEPAHRQRMIDASLLKREGTPADVAHAVAFLVTSPFVTGVCLPVDGGRTIFAGPSTDPIAHPEAAARR
jgi:pteridine reductase